MSAIQLGIGYTVSSSAWAKNSFLGLQTVIMSTWLAYKHMCWL